MRIGIDARLYGVKHTGIGRYTQNLILNLAKADRKNTYVIFGSEEIRKEIESLKRFKFVKLNTKIYSLGEQLINPFVFKKAKLDLLHVPHFNAPIFYSGKLIITLHDLIKHFSTGKDTTTHSLAIYWVKHWAYRLVVRINLTKAVSIIVPSNFWRDYLINKLKISPKKVHVTYEAADKKFSLNKKIKPNKILAKYDIEKPFLIYTGNLYPHKNVPFLIEAVNHFNQTHKHQITLALVCSRKVFKDSISPSRYVKILGYVPDDDLSTLYSQALALVQPSLMEGFGLTGLEAMQLDLPVLAADASCLPEAYGDAALYFDPRKLSDLVNKIDMIVSDPSILKDLIKKGRKQIKLFSWYKTAKQTLAVYRLHLS